MKEDAPDTQVRHFDNILARKKKKEKREKGKRSCKLRERDVRLARLRHERRVKAEEEGIPLNEVESSTKEDLSGGRIRRMRTRALRMMMVMMMKGRRHAPTSPRYLVLKLTNLLCRRMSLSGLKPNS